MAHSQNPNTTQIGGTHYTDKAIQPWDAMQAWMSPEAFDGFLVGNAIKYLARYKDKNGLQDVLKARHYLDKLIATIEARGAVKAGVVALDGNDGWIEWGGGDMPVSRGTVVEVIWRNHGFQRDAANVFAWTHTGSVSDIVAYRVVGDANEWTDVQ